MTGQDGRPIVRCYVKGAPDVLISRGGSYRDPDGTLLPVTDDNRHLALEANDRIAAAGERVMVVAQRDPRPSTFNPGGDLLSQVQDLTLLAMVGIVDPPRPEAKAAIAECKSAGIRVRMITGDHATTAGAIGKELGIEGRAITGAEFADMSDDELLVGLSEIGVIARVVSEDKVRLVRLLQQSDQIVAMTGDGVNDAPALKAANIGVAMGITGTEVSKEAAVMILTDDNFATIVGAVEYGRALYDNLLKYLRFQMSTLVAYIAIFIGAGIFAIAGGIPLDPLQILWLNMVIDILIAVALGFDEPTGGLMERSPRPVGAPVLSTSNWVRLCVQGFVMTVGTLVAYQIGEANYSLAVALDDALDHVVAVPPGGRPAGAGPGAHDLQPSAIPGPTQLRRYGLALLAIILVTEIWIPQRVHGGRPHARAVGDLHRHRAVARGGRGSDQVLHPAARADRGLRGPRRSRHLPEEEEEGMAFNLRNRSFLKELDFTPEELRFLLKLSADLKAAKYGGYERSTWPAKNIALIFEKTSTRTRTAFEVASHDQGAEVTYLEPSGSQIGHKESMKDTARVLGRTFDGIEYRGFAQETVEILAEHAASPCGTV